MVVGSIPTAGAIKSPQAFGLRAFLVASAAVLAAAGFSLKLQCAGGRVQAEEAGRRIASSMMATASSQSASATHFQQPGWSFCDTLQNTVRKISAAKVTASGLDHRHCRSGKKNSSDQRERSFKVLATHLGDQEAHQDQNIEFSV
ncbi:MAG: hypothetical protein AB3N24_11080 [Leisingera sp.]